jgi:hypothetical protein
MDYFYHCSMNLVRLLLIVLSLAWLHLTGHSQQRKGFCGAKSIPIEQIRMMGIPSYSSCDVINRVDRTLQISLHIAVDSLGETKITDGQIEGALQQLNIDFAPSGLQFVYCFRDTMLNNRFDSLSVYDDYNESIQMTSIHFEPNTINLFLVDTLGVQDFPDVAGLAGAGGFVMIEKSAYAFGSKVQAHEFGHYFSLAHTFESAGSELVDGSNCATAGDGICDTAADPDPEGNADPLDQCNYTGSVVQDSNGDWYVPPTDNIMSYYPCAHRFTVGQYNQMIAFYLTALSYLW